MCVLKKLHIFNKTELIYFYYRHVCIIRYVCMCVYTRVHNFILLFYFSQFNKFAIIRDIFSYDFDCNIISNQM